MGMGFLVSAIHKWAPEGQIQNIDTVFRAPMLADTPAIINAVVTDIDEDDALVDALFAVLGDGEKLPLSPTSMPRDVEDRLCYICVPPVEVSSNKFWGTRTHTVFLVRADGSVTAVERNRLPGEADVREEFSIF